MRLAGTEKWSPGVTLKNRRQRDLSFYDAFIETQSFAAYFDNPTAKMITKTYPLDLWYDVYKQLQPDSTPLCLTLKPSKQPISDQRLPLIAFSTLPLKEQSVSSSPSFITVHNEAEYENVVNSPEFSAESQFIISPPMQPFSWDLFMKQLPKEAEKVRKRTTAAEEEQPNLTINKQKRDNYSRTTTTCLQLPPVKKNSTRNRTEVKLKRASATSPTNATSNILSSPLPEQSKRTNSIESGSSNRFSKEEAAVTTNFPIPLLVMASQCMNGGPSVYVTQEEYVQLAGYCKKVLEADTFVEKTNQKKDTNAAEQNDPTDCVITDDDNNDDDDNDEIDKKQFVEGFFQNDDFSKMSHSSGFVTLSHRYVMASLILPVLTTVVRNDGGVEIPLSAACRGLSIWQDERMWEECLIIRMYRKVIELYGENYMEKVDEFRAKRAELLKSASAKETDSHSLCTETTKQQGHQEEEEEEEGTALSTERELPEQDLSDRHENQSDSTSNNSTNDSTTNNVPMEQNTTNTETSSNSTEDILAKYSEEEEGNALTETSLLLHAMVDLGASPKVVRRFLFSAEQLT